jgi:hypothetical protein
MLGGPFQLKTIEIVSKAPLDMRLLTILGKTTMQSTPTKTRTLLTSLTSVEIRSVFEWQIIIVRRRFNETIRPLGEMIAGFRRCPVVGVLVVLFAIHLVAGCSPTNRRPKPRRHDDNSKAGELERPG